MYGQCIKIGQCCDVYMHPLATIHFKMLLLLCKSTVACVLMEKILFVLSFTCLIKLVTESHTRRLPLLENEWESSFLYGHMKLSSCSNMWPLKRLNTVMWKFSLDLGEEQFQILLGDRDPKLWSCLSDTEKKRKKKKAAFRFTCSVFNLA